MAYEFDEIEPVTARGWWKPIAILTCLCFASAEVWAAAALAYDPESGIIGYGLGTNKATSKAAALQDCENNGSDNPAFWFWNSRGGWGAAARSDEGGGAWFIGGAIGFTKKKKAKKRAKRECKEAGGVDCQLVELFFDNLGDKSGTSGKRSWSASSAD